MSKRLFVGNLPPHLSDQEFSQLFSEFGAVHAAEVVRGRGGRGRGFGYVELVNEQEAVRAVAELNGREFHGRPLTLAEAKVAAPRRSMDDDDSHDHGSRGFGSGGRRDFPPQRPGSDRPRSPR